MGTGVVRYAVVGAGGRGSAYAAWVLANPDRAKVVAVADPRQSARERLADEHGIAPEYQFSDWRELLAAGHSADAVMICTQDRQHRQPAVAFAERGWNVLLEKPIAATEEDCLAIAQAAREGDGLFGVCHVMRYSPYTTVVKHIVDSGEIGQIESIQHLEPVGYWHFAHSYVRGLWRKESESTSMLMAKSCHDMDWLQYIVGRPIDRVSSFGSLRYFTAANKPDGAADTCVKCAVADQCPFAAQRIYHRRLDLHTWPVHHVIDSWDSQALDQALRDGPYGRCVFDCDNDVVDQQVVSMEFSGGVTGSFTLNAFNPLSDRKTRIFGSKGTIEGDGQSLTIFDFLTESTREIHIDAPGDATAGGGHSGGDAGLMDAYTQAVARHDPGAILTGAEQSLASHLAVFAAERARTHSTVEKVPTMSLTT